MRQEKQLCTFYNNPIIIFVFGDAIDPPPTWQDFGEYIEKYVDKTPHCG